MCLFILGKNKKELSLAPRLSSLSALLDRGVLSLDLPGHGAARRLTGGSTANHFGPEGVAYQMHLLVRDGKDT